MTQYFLYQGVEREGFLLLFNKEAGRTFAH